MAQPFFPSSSSKANNFIFSSTRMRTYRVISFLVPVKEPATSFFFQHTNENILSNFIPSSSYKSSNFIFSSTRIGIYNNFLPSYSFRTSNFIFSSTRMRRYTVILFPVPVIEPATSSFPARELECTESFPFPALISRDVWRTQNLVAQTLQLFLFIPTTIACMLYKAQSLAASLLPLLAGP